MPYRFTTGDIKSIALRLGLQQVNAKKWNGVDSNGNFLQTYIYDHGDGVQVIVGTAKQNALQMGFSDLENMFCFLQDKKRKR